MRFLRFGFGLSRPTSAFAGLLGLGAACVLPTSTQTAIANGDTRVLNLHHAHTGEQISVAFRVNGSYDPAALSKLNWFLRDWRNDASTKMDPRLFDVIWEAQRGAGSTAPLRVMSAYRSPETNSMLRRRSRAVAEFSQHTRGKAMDLHVPDAPISRVREVAMRMQRGGVGYYPANGFVHLDVGGVRAWPRMSYDQLARLFPDGKTVHLPTTGQPLARYEEARAEIAARGDYAMPTVAQVQQKGFFASLFGWGEDEDEAPATPARGRGAPVQTAAYAPPSDDSAAAFFRAEASGWNAARRAPAPAPAPVVAQPAAPAPVIAPVAPAIAPAISPAPAPAPIVVANAPAWMKSLDAAPLPPRRPDAAPALVAQTAAPAAVPAPALVAQTAAPAAAPAPEPAFAAPLPPRRPAEFSIAQAEPPKPPVRVAETQGLPAMIVDGASGASSSGVMAYAAAGSELTAAPRAAARSARAAPVSPQAAARARKSVLVAARLDASSFAAMTSPASVAESANAPAPAAPAKKQAAKTAARAEAVAMMFGAPALDASFATGFQPRP